MFANIVESVAIPVMARFLADLFQYDLKTPENPNGSYDIDGLYSDLLDVRIWGFANDDPAQSWARRRRAQQAARRLLATTEDYITKVSNSGPIHSLIDTVTRGPNSQARDGSLRSFGREAVVQLLAAGKTVEEAADIMMFTALGGVGAAISTASHSKPQDRLGVVVADIFIHLGRRNPGIHDCSSGECAPPRGIPRPGAGQFRRSG